MAKINEMTMSEIVDRAVELGFPTKKSKGEAYFHWNFSREMRAYEFVLKHDPEIAEEEDDDDDNDYPDDAA